MVTLYSRTHYKQSLIRRVTSRAIPRGWLFTDTETKAFTDHKGTSQRFSMGWTAYVSNIAQEPPRAPQWRYFTSELNYNHYIEDTALSRRELYLVGHNIFFDLQACGFYHYFQRWGWVMDFYYDQGLTYILVIKKADSRLVILSTTNWFDQSLRELGHLLGLAKGEVDFNSATRAELKAYCKRDVEIIIAAIRYYIAFLKANDLGKLSWTKASQAFNTYRYRFMSARIYSPSHPGSVQLARDGYYGGRVEAFFIGECTGGPFVSLDVNSMYSYVMRRWRYPSQLVEYLTDPAPERLATILSTHGVMARAVVDTPDPVYPIYFNKRTVFPVGCFETVLSTGGLSWALERGHVVRVTEAAVYTLEDLFTEYVDYFHALRLGYKEQGNAIMAKLCKYMENSLYGKFAQHDYITDIEDNETGRDYYSEDIYDFIHGGVVTRSCFMNKQIIQYPRGEGKASCVAVAAHITEYARLVLWEIIEGIGPERVLYCDTDSVKIRVSDLDRVLWPIHPTDLGALKVEQRSARLEIGGAKNYRTDAGRHIKGIPTSAREREKGVFTFASFEGQASHLRGSHVVGSRVREVTRVLRHRYNKGVVGADGRVTPFRFSAPGIPHGQPQLPF